MNPSVETKICTVEYLVHVAIIFNETLLNRKVNMNANNIEKHENNLHESLEYFKQWKESCDRNTGNIHNFLSLITYHNLRVTVCGFIAYTRLVISIATPQGTLLYVPALHSNTSSLEAWFSLVRSMRKESCHDYGTVVSTRNAASGLDCIKGQRNKSYSLADVAQQYKQEQTTLEIAFSRNDSMREHKVAEMYGKRASIQSNDTYMWSLFLLDEIDRAENLLELTVRCNNKMRQNRVKQLCTEMISFTFNGVQSLTDMLCTPCHTEYSPLRDLFTVYCRMCICTPSEHFMAALFDLNHEEEEEFSLACRSVFRKLLNIVYLELLQKNSEKTLSRITAWYTRISY